MDDPRNQLLKEIEARIALDNRYAWRHLRIATALIWIAVLASFGSVIVIAIGTVPSLITGVLAGIPGFVILLERNFLFDSRWRWHNAVETELKGLVNALKFENGKTEEVSKQYSKIMIEMEGKYPRIGTGGSSTEQFVRGIRKKR